MLEFGTDGVRGRANTELTVEFAMKFGQGVAKAMSGSTFVVGRDTRISGTMLQAAFSAGLASMGASVLDLGVIPSPGVAYLCSRLRLPGAVISASHNPYFDNGIKVIGASGSKLSQETEAEIERFAVGTLEATSVVGTMNEASHLAKDYTDFLTSLTSVDSLSGMRIVLDAGHGAASIFARRVFEAYGASVVVINDDPNGININSKAGSTYLDGLSATVLAEGADLGLAFDGDADRVLGVDENGTPIDGDVIIAVLADDLKRRGELRHGGVAVTVMSNLGLRRAMETRGITIFETPVGDRHVFEAMERYDLVLGGEQSGHVILRDISPTGDGMLTGLHFASALSFSGKAASQLAKAAMVRYPQVLVNVLYEGDTRTILESPEVIGEMEAIRSELGDQGRILVRASGTEPLIRVMVEAMDHETAEAMVARVCRLLNPMQ